MPYISATELIMYAPCFLRLPINPTVPIPFVCHPARSRGTCISCRVPRSTLRTAKRRAGFSFVRGHGFRACPGEVEGCRLALIKRRALPPDGSRFFSHKLFTPHRVHQMRQPKVHHLPLQLHSVTLRHPP